MRHRYKIVLAADTADHAAIFEAIDQTVETGVSSDEVGVMIRRAIADLGGLQTMVKILRDPN